LAVALVYGGIHKDVYVVTFCVVLGVTYKMVGGKFPVDLAIDIDIKGGNKTPIDQLNTAANVVPFEEEGRYDAHPYVVPVERAGRLRDERIWNGREIAHPSADRKSAHEANLLAVTPPRRPYQDPPGAFSLISF